MDVVIGVVESVDGVVETLVSGVDVVNGMDVGTTVCAPTSIEVEFQ